ncbi:hypothetical protein GQ457_04G023960 [Hibiscus cannabinus]
MSIPLKWENDKKIKEQGVDVNIIALKSSKKYQEDTSEEEISSTKYDCPHFNKKGSSLKKAYLATWSDEEDATNNEVSNLCLMALQEGEVTSNSSISNSYTFDELQDAYDELVFEFQDPFSKNEKLVSKLKTETDLLLKTNLEFGSKLKEFELKVLN